MPDSDSPDRLAVFNQIVTRLQPFDHETQLHILKSVLNWLNVPLEECVGLTRASLSASPHNPDPTSQSAFSTSLPADPNLHPKAFLFAKTPQTTTERVACLAYYLTHHRNTPFFKTLDLSKLNTEAAQPKFANSTYAINEALRANLLVQASKGRKQLSAIGERYVQALPDRAAARAVLISSKPPRPRRHSRTEPETPTQTTPTSPHHEEPK